MSSTEIPVTATYPTRTAFEEPQWSVQGAGRPGPLRRAPWHPSLAQLLVGAVVAFIVITGLSLFAADGMIDAQARCRELMATDWARAERECGARYLGTEPAQAAPGAANDATAEQPPQAPAAAPTVWVTQDTGAAYDRTDAAASPLDLARCTTSTGYAELPCLASVSSDGARAVVLEEDASLTALVRR